METRSCYTARPRCLHVADAAAIADAVATVQACCRLHTTTVHLPPDPLDSDVVRRVLNGSFRCCCQYVYIARSPKRMDRHSPLLQPPHCNELPLVLPPIPPPVDTSAVAGDAVQTRTSPLSTGRCMHVSHQWATKNGTPGTPPPPASAMRSCVMWFVTDTFARHMTHDTRNTRRVPIPGMSGRAACRLSWAFPLFIISMLTHSVTLSAELELGGPGAWGDLGRQWGALCDVCHSLIHPHARGPAPAVRGLGHCVMRH